MNSLGSPPEPGGPLTSNTTATTNTTTMDSATATATNGGDPLVALASQLQQRPLTAATTATTGAGSYTASPFSGGSPESFRRAPLVSLLSNSANSGVSSLFQSHSHPFPSTLATTEEDPLAASATAAAASTSRSRPQHPREIAQFLISKDYLLTALEFYTELAEDGIEIRELRDYFANHKHFENRTGRYYPHTGIQHVRSFSDTYSVNDTVSSAEEGHSRMSNSEQMEVLREKDEYIAVLEYELRQAKDAAEKFKLRLANMVKDEVEISAGGTGRGPPSSSGGTKPLVAQQLHQESHSDGSHVGQPVVQTGSRGQILNLPANIQPQEARVLNYLVNEYLQLQCYKMTALTFADENEDQDLEDWEDVMGVSKDIVPPPPNLVHIYRTWKQGGMLAQARSPSTDEGTDSPVPPAVGSPTPTPLSVRESSSAPVEVPDFPSSVEKPLSVPTENVSVPTPSAPVSVQPRRSSKSLVVMDRMQEEELPKPRQITAIANPPSRITPSTQTASVNSPTKTLLPVHKLFRLYHVNVAQTGETKAETEALKHYPMIDIVGSVLPGLIPNTLINKREELLPLLVATIIQLQDVEIQTKLVGHLLHLVRRPNIRQRQSICDACLSILEHDHSDRFLETIMHHCTELAANKFSERRVLAADLCGQLAPYLGSLTVDALSILSSLAGEANPEIRYLVVKNLSILVNYVNLEEVYMEEEGEEGAAATENEEIKEVAVASVSTAGEITQPTVYRKIRTLVTQFVCDGNAEVARLSLDILLPVFMDLLRKYELKRSTGAGSSEIGMYAFAQGILNRVSMHIQPKMDMPAEEAVEASGMRTEASTSESAEIAALLKVLDCICQHVYLLLLLSSPFGRKDVTSDGDSVAGESDLFVNNAAVQSLQTKFEVWLQSQNGDPANPELWPALSWTLDTLLRYLLVMMQNVMQFSTAVITEMVHTTRTFCTIFGKTFVDLYLRDTMERGLGISPKQEGNATKTGYLCMYVCGVLALQGQDQMEVVNLCKTIYLRIATSTGGWSVERDLTPFRTTLVFLCSLHKKLPETLMQAFIDLTENEDTNVRVHLAGIAALFVPISSSTAIQRKLIPWVNQLSNDSQRSVRIASVQAYAPILEFGGRDREICDKMEIQLSTFLDDPIAAIKTDTLLVIASKAHCLDETFRDSVLLPSLLRWTTMEMRGKKPVDDIERLVKVQLLLAGLEVYLAFSRMFLPDSPVQQYMLPALLLMQKEVPLLSFEEKATELALSRSLGSKNALSLTSPDVSTGEPSLDPAAAAVEEQLAKDDLNQFNETLVSCKSIISQLMARYAEKKGGVFSFRSNDDLSDIASPVKLLHQIKRIQYGMMKRHRSYLIEPDLQSSPSRSFGGAALTSTFSATQTTSAKLTSVNEDTSAISQFKKTTALLGSKLFQKFQATSSAPPSTASAVPVPSLAAVQVASHEEAVLQKSTRSIASASGAVVVEKKDTESSAVAGTEPTPSRHSHTASSSRRESITIGSPGEVGKEARMEMSVSKRSLPLENVLPPTPKDAISVEAPPPTAEPPALTIFRAESKPRLSLDHVLPPVPSAVSLSPVEAISSFTPLPAASAVVTSELTMATSSASSVPEVAKVKPALQEGSPLMSESLPRTRATENKPVRPVSLMMDPMFNSSALSLTTTYLPTIRTEEEPSLLDMENTVGSNVPASVGLNSIAEGGGRHPELSSSPPSSGAGGSNSGSNGGSTMAHMVTYESPLTLENAPTMASNFPDSLLVDLGEPRGNAVIPIPGSPTGNTGTDTGSGGGAKKKNFFDFDDLNMNDVQFTSPWGDLSAPASANPQTVTSPETMEAASTVAPVDAKPRKNFFDDDNVELPEQQKDGSKHGDGDGDGEEDRTPS